MEMLLHLGSFPIEVRPLRASRAREHALMQFNIAPCGFSDCKTITTVVNYPWCWNGKELATGQPSTHVSYPNGTDWVDCPDPEYVHPAPF